MTTSVVESYNSASRPKYLTIWIGVTVVIGVLTKISINIENGGEMNVMNQGHSREAK